MKKRTVLTLLVSHLAVAGAGFAAGSIALVGFGLDSVIECAAAGVLLWRLSLEARGADRERLELAERRVHRFVGATFVSRNDYPREAFLEAILRFLEEDLAAER